MAKLFEDMGKIADIFLRPMNHINGDENNRGYSWNHCYDFFQGYIKNNPKNGKGKELACLNLAFFLASWGMYRGSSFLLSKDYKVFGGVIDILIKQDYRLLWDASYYDNLLDCKEVITTENEQVKQVFRLYNEIKSYFSSLSFIKNPITSQSESARATDTLVTKILLGTMACTPAYDTIFKNGLRHNRIRYHSSFTDNSLASLLEVCRGNIDT